MTKIPFSTRKTGIIADGSYRIFEITDQNHIVDLSDCISIEQSATKSEGDFIIPLGTETGTWDTHNTDKSLAEE